MIAKRKSIEVEAKTTKEAIAAALKNLNLKKGKLILRFFAKNIRAFLEWKAQSLPR